MPLCISAYTPLYFFLSLYTLQPLDCITGKGDGEQKYRYGQSVSGAKIGCRKLHFRGGIKIETFLLRPASLEMNGAMRWLLHQAGPISQKNRISSNNRIASKQNGE
jgi:hypothetical protein